MLKHRAYKGSRGSREALSEGVFPSHPSWLPIPYLSAVTNIASNCESICHYLCCLSAYSTMRSSVQNILCIRPTVGRPLGRMWIPLASTLIGVMGRGFQIRKRRRRKDPICVSLLTNQLSYFTISWKIPSLEIEAIQWKCLPSFPCRPFISLQFFYWLSY